MCDALVCIGTGYGAALPFVNELEIHGLVGKVPIDFVNNYRAQTESRLFASQTDPNRS